MIVDETCADLECTVSRILLYFLLRLLEQDKGLLIQLFDKLLSFGWNCSFVDKSVSVVRNKL